jgi:hypothetical protein
VTTVVASAQNTIRRQGKLEVDGSEKKIAAPKYHMQVHKKFKFHNLYSSPNIFRQIKSRQMRWVVHVSHMGERRKVYKVLVGKPEGKRPLGTPSHRWENGIRMYLRE